jgi:hypothetical protein
VKMTMDKNKVLETHVPSAGSDSAVTSAEEQRAAVFLDSVRRELDAASGRLDGRTLSRLHRIRSEALSRRTKPAASDRSWWPLGGLAAAGLLAVNLTLNWSQPSAMVPQDGQAEALEDIDLLTANDALELYEDYEFYQWLAQQ